MEGEEGIYRVWRNKDHISSGSQSESEETPNRSSAEPSPGASPVSLDDRLLPAYQSSYSEVHSFLHFAGQPANSTLHAA